MVIKDEISKKQKEFTLMCKSHNVRYLYAFGSSVSEKFDNEKSDIDLLVEINTSDPLERG